MQCEYPDCSRKGRVRVENLKYCIKHYNFSKREVLRLLKGDDGGEVKYDVEDEIIYLRYEAQRLVYSIDDAHRNQDNCTNISCRMKWRKNIAECRRELEGYLEEITKLEEESPIVAREKHFQQSVRSELRKIGWKTYKNVGNVALPGMPDIMGRTKWGGIALIEFKGGTPVTEQEALKMLKGAQKAVLTDLAFVDAPAIVCVGDLDRGTIVELKGLLNKNRCGILHYVHVAEVACQIEGWLRAWIKSAPTKWENEVDERRETEETESEEQEQRAERELAEGIDESGIIESESGE